MKKLIKTLSKIRGRHTELVSVYVPAGYNINEMKNLIANELGTATNIKSRATRKNVLGSLEKVAQKLKTYKETPKNGLAIFCGNVSEKEGVSDIEIWTVEFEEPVNQRLYRCDQRFVLEPLESLVREKEIFGLVTIDSADATVAFLRGKSISIFKKLSSFVPGKTGKGGQSAQRYERVRRGLLLTFEKEVGEIATKAFEKEKDLVGIILGGPGPIKDDFAEGDFLSEAMKRKILGIKDIGYSDTSGIKELVDRSEDILRETSVVYEKNLLNKFFLNLQKETSLSIYGIIEVKKALDSGAVDTLIMSEAFEFDYFEVKCRKCSYEESKVIRKDRLPSKCPDCGSDVIVVSKDIYEEFERLCEASSAKMEIVSDDTPEGVSFLRLGGIGAILRYRTT
ncbi:MAG: peptide chain release factor aRF-1 [archaeon]|nr:peptide chain release factor aRF-1 [archaeon]